MTSRSTAALRRAVVAALIAGAATALAGCVVAPTTPVTTVTATETETVTTSPSTSPSASPTSSADAGCRTSSLSASAGDAPGGGAAGSFGIRIVLTNTGSASCILQGWPGISFVGDGNGTQIGQPSDFDRDSPHPTVTLAPGGTAYVDVQVAEAGNYSSDECGPTPVDGFRVFPPEETNALFAETSGLTGCSSTDVHLLTSGAMQPGS